MRQPPARRRCYATRAPAFAATLSRMPAIDTSALLSSPEVSFSAQPPLSLYVHIPWCVRKCPYCDFNSHELRAPAAGAADGRALDRELETQYVEALTRDLEYALPQIWGRRVLSVFFGGGTPSLLSASALDQILSGIRARVQLDPERGGDAGGQPRDVRGREVRAISLTRHQPIVDRHSELQRSPSARARAHPRRRRGPPRGRDARARPSTTSIWI